MTTDNHLVTLYNHLVPMDKDLTILLYLLFHHFITYIIIIKISLIMDFFNLISELNFLIYFHLKRNYYSFDLNYFIHYS